MAYAVLRKRVSTESFGAPPLKRSRTSLTSAASINMGRVWSLVSQLSRTDSNMGTTSHMNQGQSGTKRKREASPEPLAKRQRLHSTSHEHNTLSDEQLALLVNDPHTVSMVTFDLYENVEAPTREHLEVLEVVQWEYARLINMKLDLNEFLQKYPDPLRTFDVKEPDVTEIYYDYTEVFLKNEFRSLQVSYIKKTLQKSGFHLTPAYNILKANLAKIEAYRVDKRKWYFKAKYRMYPRAETYEYPQGRDVIDEDFFWERLFILNQEEILGTLGGNSAEVMDTTPAVFAEVTTSNNGATTSNNGATPFNNAATLSMNGATKDIQMEIPRAIATAEGADTAAHAQAGTTAAADVAGAVGGAAPKESFTDAALAAQFDNDLELICEIHPEVDPVYIREQLTLLVNDPCRVSTVTFDLYENVEAPKREHREALEVVQREYKRLINMKFDLNEFLEKYPNPLSAFDVREPDVTEIYYDYAEVFLKNEFRSLQVTYIQKTLQKSGFHLTPAYYVLKADNDKAKTYRGDKRKLYFKEKYHKYPRSETYEYPQGRDVIDDDFFWERFFILNQEDILGHIAAEKEAKQLRLDEARREGRLRECTICVSSEVLLEDMVACQNEHLFCTDCVRQSTEELLGQGRASFPCLEAECGCQYMLATLEKAVKPETYSLVVRRVQAEEIRLADIEDMVSCPFCPYAVVICDDVSSSVFHCENPVCMEDSCRKCKEVAHPPYSCEEFKLKKEAEFEHFMENRMAEAMIRNCPKCDLRFYKEEGCNNMRCTKCRTSICYVCRQEIKGYDHFSKNSTCRNYNDTNLLHRNEITAAFKEADTKYREQHPELRNTNIVFAEYNLLEALNI